MWVKKSQAVKVYKGSEKMTAWCRRHRNNEGTCGYVLNDLLAGRTARPAGEQTGLADSIEFWARESDGGRFGCLSCQQIGWPTHVPAGRYAGRSDSQTGLCPIY